LRLNHWRKKSTHLGEYCLRRAIQKAYGDLAVDCKKGDAVASTKFKSSSNGGVWGNILAGGIIGYAVDASSGAGFDYPSTMTVTLPPPCGTSTQKTAAVD